jgi:formylglycine-generating enzyme required for sulfatase activity
MKRIYGALLILCFMALAPKAVFANNLVVENISLVDQDTVNDTYDIQFDIAWDNSWFISGAPSATANWDAAWVFAKYSVYSGGSWSDWAHCTLLNTGYVAPAGSQMSFGDTGGVYKGAFIYRSAAGSGTVDWNDAEIRWDYGTDGVADNATIKVKVFAIEMVLIPQGSFYVGDTDNDNTNCFREGGAITEFQITSENAITVSDTAGNLYYDADNAYAGDQSGPIPAAFPKGYNAFYIMKYEISQRQYCEFLNTLTSTQAGNRISNQYGNYRNYIKLASNGKYGTDADNDAGVWGSANWDLMNESNDGEWVACNYLSYMDVAAYADWAALRPFTELEFEKAARGGQTAVDDEYAWGNTTLESATTSLTNAATASEAPNQGNLNYSSCLPDGPYRVGSYADATSTRTNAGAGYYGVLDLSGNLWERPVTVGNSTGRAFTGTHGDGSLSTNGHATNSDWPGYSGGEITGATGSGFRGGYWRYGSSYSRVSDRYNAAYTSTGRYYVYGGRCARTSP